MTGTGHGPSLSGSNINSTINLKANLKGDNALDELKLFTNKNPNATYLCVPDDTMAPFYYQGDFVAGIRLYAEDIKNADEKDCIVQLGTGEILIRRLKIYENDKIALISTNLDSSVYPPAILEPDIVSAAPVIWRRQVKNLQKSDS
jgi:hypothetical protein